MSSKATAEQNAWVAAVLGISTPRSGPGTHSDAAAIHPEALSVLGAAAGKLPGRPDGPPPSVRTASLIRQAISEPPPPAAKEFLAHLGRLAAGYVVAVQEEPASSSTALREGSDLPRQDWMLDFGVRYNSLQRDLQDWGRLLADAERARSAVAALADTEPSWPDLIDSYAKTRAACLDAQALVMAGMRTLSAEFEKAQARQSNA
jgi:hypothetical protein